MPAEGFCRERKTFTGSLQSAKQARPNCLTPFNYEGMDLITLIASFFKIPSQQSFLYLYLQSSMLSVHAALHLLSWSSAQIINVLPLDDHTLVAERSK